MTTQEEIIFEQTYTNPYRKQVGVMLLGQILKNKRQEKGIKLSEIANYLHVKSRDIEAIENNDFSILTKHLYIPGLLRSYAKFLKIDNEIIEEQIKLLHIESNTNNRNHLLVNIGEPTSPTPDKDTFLNFAVISALLFFTLLSLYNFYENKTATISSDILEREFKKIDLQ